MLTARFTVFCSLAVILLASPAALAASPMAPMAYVGPLSQNPDLKPYAHAIRVSPNDTHRTVSSATGRD